MSDNPKSTFARRVRAARPRARKYEIRDDMVTGLGLAVQPTGVRTFVFNRMVRERRRYATVGSADAMTVPEARTEGRKLVAAFLDTVKNDNGPRTPGHPMDAFAAEFLDRQAWRWKPGTRESNAYLVRKYILPAFRHMTVDASAVEHVKDWFASMADRPGAANRAMPVLSMMMRMAELWGYRSHNSNPCKNARRYRMEPKARFLAAEEMARLNAVLTRDEFYCPQGRRRYPPADADRVPLRRSRLARMGLDSRHAHPSARLEVRTAHGLAVERHARRHRRHPAIQPGLPVPVSGQRGTSTTSSTNGPASATRRACPDCGCMTFAIAGLRSPP